MGTVAIATFFTDAWDEIYSHLNSNLTNPHTTGKWIYSSFPDKRLEQKSVYPLVVVNPFDPATHTQFTFSTSKVTSNFTIDIFSTSASSIDSISSDVLNNLKSQGDLSSTYMYKLRLVSSSYGTNITKKFKVHVKSLTFSIDFYYGG